MNQTSRPNPLPSPVFKIPTSAWEGIEDELSVKIEAEIRRFIIYYCNEYIINVCRFHENNNKSKAVAGILKKFDAAEDVIKLLEEARKIRRGNICDQTRPEDQENQKISYVLRHMMTDKAAEADSIIDEKYAEPYGLSPNNYEARTIRRIFENQASFEENILAMKCAFDRLRSHLSQETESLKIYKKNHGDPYIDALTIRLLIAFNKSGGKGKFKREPKRFISFIYKNMIDNYFFFFKKNVYSSILDFGEEAIGKRIKWATTNLGTDSVKNLDTIHFFADPTDHEPGNIKAIMFRMSQIGLS